MALWSDNFVLFSVQNRSNGNPDRTDAYHFIQVDIQLSKLLEHHSAVLESYIRDPLEVESSSSFSLDTH